MSDDALLGWTLVGGLIIGLAVGVRVTSGYQRDIFCPALLEHAATAGDSLALGREFGGCWDHVKEVTP